VYVPSSEWKHPQPLSRKRVCPPPLNQGWGAHLPAGGGGGGHWGSPNSDDWRKSLALYLLCGSPYRAPTPPPPHRVLGKLLTSGIICHFPYFLCRIPCIFARKFFENNVQKCFAKFYQYTVHTRELLNVVQTMPTSRNWLSFEVLLFFQLKIFIKCLKTVAGVTCQSHIQLCFGLWSQPNTTGCCGLKNQPAFHGLCSA
jgi:hypothetical protein